MKVANVVVLVLTIGFLSVVHAQDSQWSIDKPLSVVPDIPLQGQIFGKEFKFKSATISKVALNLSSTGEPWPDGELTIFVGKDELENEIVVTPDSEGLEIPHIHMVFTRPGKKFQRRLMYTEEYSMRLTVMSKTESEINAKIHVSLPDYKRSYLVGTFTAKVQE